MLLLLAACSPWDFDTRYDNYLDEPLWDPVVAPLADGVYVRLPTAGKLLRVSPNGDWAEVDLDGATPIRMVTAPDGHSLLVLATWPTCADEDPKIRYASDCADEDLGTAAELDLVQDGKLVSHLDIAPQFQSFAFNKNGSIAAAYLDLNASQTVGVQGLLNPDAVAFVETATATVHEVAVGFPPETVIFSDDGSKSVVLSRSQVAIVDLATWAVQVTFPLTLDANTAVTPQDVVLARDGRYALVSVQGSADLYVLDLEDPHIDLVELEGVPSDMVVDPSSDRTVLVYSGRSVVESLEHDYFEITATDLDAPANRILDSDTFTVLYSANGGNAVSLFDPATGALSTYRAENPILDVQLTVDQSFAVATLSPDYSVSGGASGFYDQYYGLGIFPMVEDAHPVSLVLQGQPVGLELVDRQGASEALVLMAGIESLLQVDIATGTASPIELEVPPIAINAMPDGTFVISHDAVLGQLSFLDSSTGNIVTAAGFASTGMLKTDLLPRRAE